MVLLIIQAAEVAVHQPMDKLPQLLIKVVMVVPVHHHQYQVLLLHMQVAAVDILAVVQLLQVVPVAAAMVEISMSLAQL
jgi:hypothetical protein